MEAAWGTQCILLLRRSSDLSSGRIDDIIRIVTVQIFSVRPSFRCLGLLAMRTYEQDIGGDRTLLSNMDLDYGPRNDDTTWNESDNVNEQNISPDRAGGEAASGGRKVCTRHIDSE